MINFIVYEPIGGEQISRASDLFRINPSGLLISSMITKPHPFFINGNQYYHKTSLLREWYHMLHWRQLNSEKNLGPGETLYFTWAEPNDSLGRLK